MHAGANLFIALSDPLADIALFAKSDEKGSVTRVQLTCSTLPRTALKAASRSPGSLGFPGNSGSRDAPSIGVFSTLALSCSALDRWRLGGELYNTPSKTAKVLPSCPSSGWGCRLEYYTCLQAIALSRSPCACAPGGSLQTGAILKAPSAGGVSGSALYSSALWRPIGSQASYLLEVF